MWWFVGLTAIYLTAGLAVLFPDGSSKRSRRKR